MLRLMGELGERPVGGPRRMQHALEGIAKLVGADFAYTTRGTSTAGDRKFQPYAILSSGWETGQLGRAIRIAAIDPFHDFINADLQERVGRPAGVGDWPFVFLRDRMSRERVHARANAADEFKETAGGDIDVAILYPAAGLAGHFASLGLLRESCSRRRFSAREIQLATLIWEALTEVHQAPLAAVDERLWGAHLSPRQIQVLDGLRAGLGVKQVAHRLGLSAYTVSEYIGNLYRKYGVTTRGELLSLFLRA